MRSLWDWRRQVAGLYAAVRAAESAEDGWRLWRAGRDRLFREHPQSPIEDRSAFTALPFYDYDPALRFAVGLRGVEGEVLTQSAGADGAMRLRPFARTDGLRAALGSELTLYWIEGYGGGVLLPFKDQTSGRESFGGGRYVLDTIKGADLGDDGAGRTLIDFNFAYNPSCSYSDRYICPLAPAGNRLAGRVAAGERI